MYVLRESDNLSKDLFYSAACAIFIYQDNKFVYVNKTSEELTGYSREELLGKDFWEIVHPEFRSLIKNRGLARQQGEEVPDRYELKIIKKDGKEVWIDFTSRKISWHGRNAAVGTAIDITQYKQVETSLRESEERFRSVYENSTIGIYRTTPNGRILLANPELVKMLGYSSFEELAKRNLEEDDRFEVHDRTKFRSIIEKEGKIKRFESRWRRKDGSILFVRESARVIRDANGKILYYDGVVEDITEQKIAEEKEKEHQRNISLLSEAAMQLVEFPSDQDLYVFIAEQLQKFIGEKSYIIVNSIDTVQGILVNRALVGVGNGYKKIVKLLGKDIRNIVYNFNDKELSYLKDGKLHDSERTLYEILLKTVPRKLCSMMEKIFHLGKIYTIGLVKENKLFGTVVIFLRKDYSNPLDKTVIETFIKQASIAIQRRQAEQRIKHLNLILSAVRNVNQLTVNEKDRSRFISKACRLLTETRGYSSAWIILLDENSRILEAAQSGIGKRFTKVLKLFETGSMIECCRRAIKEKGLVFIQDTEEECIGCPFLGMEPSERTFTVRLEHEGRIYGLFSVSIPESLSIDNEEQGLFEELAGDIAFALYGIELEREHKKAEEALRISEDRLSKIMIAANEGTWDWDLNTNEIYFDHRYYEMAGYSIDEFPHCFEEFQKRVHPDDIAGVMKSVENHLKGESERFIVEFRFKTKQGSWMWILGIGLIVERDKNGKPLRFVGTHTDITDKKLMEEELKLSEKKFRILFEFAPEGYYIHDMKGKLIDGNKAAEEIIGYKKEELIGQSLLSLDLLPKSQVPKATALLAETVLGKKVVNRELTLIRKDGKNIEIEISGFPVTIHGEKFVLGIMRDITERKRAEESLKQSEIKFRTIFESSNDAMFIMQNDIFLDCNASTLKIFKCKRDYIIGKSPYQFSPEFQPDGRDSKSAALEYINAALKGEPQFFEWNHCRLDGSVFPTEVSLNRFVIGEETFIQASVRDISERKRAEEALKKSLKEKDVLIREIHHRVKNNLQIIHSLISLQQRGLEDKDAVKLFDETKGRVLVMARVHELLYRSDNLAEINFKEYIERMVSELLSGSDIRNKVDLKLDIQNISMSIDTAIPCGLILNELITNSLKYAFKGMSSGSIYVSFSRDKNNTAKMVVKDTGIGMPENVDCKNPKSFGMTLINILTEQLEGTLQFNSENGTQFVITFPLDTP